VDHNVRNNVTHKIQSYLSYAVSRRHYLFTKECLILVIREFS